jgi:hypothetical protein
VSLLSQVRKQRQREKRKLALAVYANRTTRIVRELHPNQETIIERIETVASQPAELNTYGLKAALGVMLYRVWLYSVRDCLPETEYKLRRQRCEPLVDDRERGLYLL